MVPKPRWVPLLPSHQKPPANTEISMEKDKNLGSVRAIGVRLFKLIETVLCWRRLLRSVFQGRASLLLNKAIFSELNV